MKSLSSTANAPRLSLNLSPTSIAITGGKGNIGREFPAQIPRLETRLEATLDEKINELKHYTNLSCLIHLAGLVSVKDCEADPERAFELNVGGALSWYNAAREVGLKRFIQVSSSHVYAPSLKPLNTTDELKPHAVYGKTKLAAESELLKVSSSSSCELVIARVFSVLADPGPHWSVLEGLKRRAFAGDLSPIPGLDNVRDFLWTSEVAEKLERLAQAEKPPQFVNICSGRPTKIREIAEPLFQREGHDVNLLKVDLSQPSGNPFIVGVPTQF